MPIRSVKVDWDDESQITNQNRRGLYQNRKPVCERTDTPGTTKVGYCRNDASEIFTELTCSDNKGCPDEYSCIIGNELAADRVQKRFGNLPRACTDKYFEFVHEYSCSKQDIVGEAGYTEPVGLLPANIQTQIRLQAGGDIERVCVFTPRVQVTDNWGWCNGSCDGAGNTGCYEARDCSTNSDLPWTSFGGGEGQIIVIPDID